MQGINRRLVLPTLLAGVVVISSLVLTKTSATTIEEVLIKIEQLPMSSGRAVVVTTTDSENFNDQDQPELTQTQAAPSKTIETSLTPTIPPQPTLVTESTPLEPTPSTLVEHSPPETPHTIQATLVIQGPGISLKRSMELEENTSVYAFLKQASKKFDFSLKVSQHSSLGAFVEGLAGTVNDPKNNRYWLYYVNGQFASRGVSSQIVKEGDLIQWSYE